MQVEILGPLQLGGGDPIRGGARMGTLLVRLALDAGRAVTTDALASAVWPAGSPTQNALQTMVSRLRRALPEPVLDSVPGGYRLAVSPDAVDALRFERLAADGRQRLDRGDAAGAAGQLREALALWRGDALAGAVDSPYLAAAAARLAELRLAAAEDRIAADLATRAVSPAGLVAELRELVTAQPLRERLHALLVHALHACGRGGEALTAYEHARQLLAEQLGADPGPQLRRAHLAALRSEPPRPVGNLPAELTSFVGRGEERARIGKQLAEGRLVTLVGPGGAGKTRLATTVAAEVAETEAGTDGGGVWLVELAPVSDPGEIAPTIAGVLGGRATGTGAGPGAGGSGDPIAQLVDALATTEALLVLDNCEHLLAAVAPLVDRLLRHCPRLRVLATSREPLGIAGEVLVPVAPLDVPPPGATAATALTYPAVALFADRAAAVRPDVAVTDGTVEAVVEICRRLDGLPLAIELAAARLRSLTLGQVAGRLDDRFRLLTGGSRAVLPRHQTLRAVVAWSWELLNAGERQAAARLAVFADVITPEAAARVAGAGVDTLAALVDRSLLQLRDGAQPQYRMLETIREYGREQLAAAGELTVQRAAHAGYYLELAERAAPHLRGADQPAWVARLQADGGHAAAFAFTRESGDTDTLVRLAAALSHFWTVQGDHVAAARRLRVAVTAPGEAPAAARAVVAAGYLVNVLLAGGDAGEAVASVAAARGGWPAGHPAAALAAAVLALAGNDTAAGLRATDRFGSDPDPWTRGMVWLLRSWLHGNDGAIEALYDDLEAAVAAFREAGDRWGLAVSLTHRAHVQTMRGDLGGAVAGLTEALAQQRALGVADGATLQRVLLAAARTRHGDRDRARAELAELVAPGRSVSTGNLVLARLALGDLARWDGDLVGAGQHYEAAAAALARVPFDATLFRAMLRCAQGHLAIAAGEVAAAESYLAEALARAVAAPDLPIAAGVGVGIARLRHLAGAPESAAEVLGAADTLRGAPDVAEPEAAALVAVLRAELGVDGLAAAYQRGRGLARTEALAVLQAQVRAPAAGQARRR